MTKPKKVGGLLLILAVPLLILIFLEQFGEQHYAIPTDPSEAEGLSAEVPAGSLGQTFRLPKPLFNASGEVVSEKNFARKILILYYLPVAKADTAELVLEKLTRVQNVFEQDTLVRLLTVVPTQQIDSLTQLAQQYRAQPGVWNFVADTTQGKHLASLMPKGTNAATLVLIDQARQIRGYYHGTQEKEIDRLVAETRILLYGVK
jgi:protein SCO1/2